MQQSEIYICTQAVTSVVTVSIAAYSCLPLGKAAPWTSFKKDLLRIARWSATGSHPLTIASTIC